MRLVGAIKGMSQNRGQNKDWEPVINITNINIIELDQSDYTWRWSSLPQPNVNAICTIWLLFLWTIFTHRVESSPDATSSLCSQSAY